MASVSHPILRFLRNAGAFALALAAMCVAINSRLPSLRVFGLSDKLDVLRNHRGEFDTVFIGSSRVYHAFDPVQFDRELGESARSFNLGIDGMRPPESFYVLRELLKLRLPLRRVFIELGDINPKVNAANLTTARYVHWHDLRHTALVLRHVAVSREALSVKWDQVFVHASCFLARMSNFGRGPEWLAQKLLGPEPAWHADFPWQDHAGFEAHSASKLEGTRRINYESAVHYLEHTALQHAAIPSLLGAALRDVVAEVRGAGAQPVFVITPTVLARENLVDLAAARIDAPLIAFTDPLRHPALFRTENHCDEEHLNATGAAEFTRALAEEFAALPR